MRTPGSDLLAVHVSRDDGLTADPDGMLDRQRALITSVGGSLRQVPGEDVPETLLRFAQAENATQMVLGASRRGRFVTLFTGKSIPTRVARRAEHIDVHLVSREDNGHVDKGHGRPARAGLGSRRGKAAWASAEAAALTRLASCVLRGHGDPPALLEEIRQMFGLAAVSLLEPQPGGAGCYIVASAGDQPPEGPGADLELPVTETTTLACRGRVWRHEDMRVLRSCAAQIVAGLDSWPRHEQEAEATRHAADLRSRMTLLAATGENAREHLEQARAALTALADHGVAVTPQDRATLASARRAVDYVSRLIDDLRDLSRLHAGAVDTYLRPVDLDEVVADALDDLGPGRQHVTLSTAEDLPDVIADAALLTRILTSLLADAWQRCPAGPMPVLTAVALTDQVEIRICDQGPDSGDGTASLALRLARDLAEAMGDTLRCERTPGGRTVIVTLPASARRPAAPLDGAGPQAVLPSASAV